jgi:diadenylate cyclase
MPNASIPTTETGTRHRTAERVARSVDVPVVSVSSAMSVITVYRHHDRHALQPASRLHERISQALQTVQRFRTRFDVAVATLSALEVEDTVTVRDVAAVLQPAELVVRIGREVGTSLLELGEDGRLLALQLEELVDGVAPVRQLVVNDYLQVGRTAGHRHDSNGAAEGPGDIAARSREVLRALGRLSTDELLEARRVAAALGIPPAQSEPDASLEPRGYRLLHRLPRFPEAVLDRIVEHFVGFQRIMRASVRDLEEVGGVGEARARSVKEGLSRLAEASILDRYS